MTSHLVALFRVPVGLRREDVRLGVRMKRAVGLEEMADVQVPAVLLHEMGSSDDVLAAFLGLALEKGPVVVGELVDLVSSDVGVSASPGTS